MSVSIAIVPLGEERQGLALCLHCDSCFTYVGQIPYQAATQEQFTTKIEESASVGGT